MKSLEERKAYRAEMAKQNAESVMTEAEKEQTAPKGKAAKQAATAAPAGETKPATPVGTKAAGWTANA